MNTDASYEESSRKRNVFLINSGSEEDHDNQASTSTPKQHQTIKAEDGEDIGSEDDDYGFSSIPWQGVIDSVEMINTCTVDVGLQILYMLCKLNERVKDFYHLHSKDAVIAILLDALDMVDINEHESARGLWLQNVLMAKKEQRLDGTEVYDLWGSEAQQFVHYIIITQKAVVTDVCNGTNCPNPRRNIYQKEIILNVPTVVENKNLLETAFWDCTRGRDVPCMRELKNEQHKMCTGRRKVSQWKFDGGMPTVLVASVEMLGAVIASSDLDMEIDINNVTYKVAAVTQMEHGHDVGFIRVHQEWYSYDGMRTTRRLRPVKKVSTNNVQHIYLIQHP